MSHAVNQQHRTVLGKWCAFLLLDLSCNLDRDRRRLLSGLGILRKYPLSSHLVIEWEAAGNISKCKLTFNYTKISFRDHFSCQADSHLLKHFPFMSTPLIFPNSE